MNQYLSLFCENRNNEDFSLSKDMVLSFVARRNGETPRTREMRESIIRQFAIFLDSLGIDAYIIPLRKKKEKSTFTPFIFTKQQIADIFKITDNLKYEYRSPNHHFVYPFLIRLLYSCGLRISEALTMKIEDIDFDDGILRINQAKYNNSRLVPMSDSLIMSLNKYIKQVGYTQSDKDFLFRTRWDKPYKAHSILQRFKVFLVEAGICYTENGKLPRLHDLRHTFAVHSLDYMALQGLDTYCAIPYLSAFMGHRKIACTEQYLRLTVESHNDIINALSPLYENLFPEVAQDEQA
jgi:integrase